MWLVKELQPVCRLVFFKWTIFFFFEILKRFLQIYSKVFTGILILHPSRTSTLQHHTNNMSDPMEVDDDSSGKRGSSSTANIHDHGGARQYHVFDIAGNRFEVDLRYTNLIPVGGGSYGLVCSADDSVTKRRVAIKKVTNAFSDLTDAKRIMREIKLLGQLGDHENVIGLVDVMTMPPLTKNFRDIYIVCELMECDLDRIISSTQGLTDQHAQYFVYQILRGLKYIHSANVLHRDLKPSNLLVNSNCDLSICDFGLARGVVADETLTEYVVTRWYRAPELLTESQYYGPPVDLWSVGCILAEVLLRRPLFQGKDYMHQLEEIINVLGTPSDESLAFITNSMAKRAIMQVCLELLHRVLFCVILHSWFLLFLFVCFRFPPLTLFLFIFINLNSFFCSTCSFRRGNEGRSLNYFEDVMNRQ